MCFFDQYLNNIILGRYRYKRHENVEGGGRFAQKWSKKWYKIQSIAKVTLAMTLIVFIGVEEC